MAIEQTPITTPIRVNPYTVPPDHQGWRGIGIDSVSAKRRAYTLFWNEQVLVCGLLLLPGERSIRHSHESGELSISFSDALHPSVGYTPGGVLHGGAPQRADAPAQRAPLLAETIAAAVPGLRDLLETISEEQARLQKQIEELYESMAPPAGPRMLIDILFPPFTTTIDDPIYPEPRTIVGPWYD